MDTMEAEGGVVQLTWTASVRQSLDDVVRAADAEQQLVAAARLQRYAERLTAEVVAAARAQDEPISWARIGGALGISRQSANERFAEAGRAGAQLRRFRRARRLERLRAQAAQPEATGSFGST
jgi:hypothetical protein